MMSRLTVLIFLCLIYVSDSTSQEVLRSDLIAQIEHEVSTNDIWGYVAQDGTEYAVVGTIQDARIYSLSDPAKPQLVAQIPGAVSQWRDYKSYGTFVYQITQRGRDGLTIIDMTNAPDSIGSKTFTPTLEVNGIEAQLLTCHNLFIDDERGLAFLAGCNNGVGGILIFDLTSDPLNPTFVNAIDDRYSHDVVVRGDTLFSSEINEGNLAIYDIEDLNNPIIRSRTRTTSVFTHNAWFSDDGNFVFTTDERANSNVDAYDITDVSNPVLLDTYRPFENRGIIPHNTHYYDGFLVTSWYTEGVIVLDAHRPDNLVKVAQYDTYQLSGTGFNGCWGAYPYLPSGVVLASDLSGGLFVLDVDYQRAGYLEGIVIDIISGSSINGAVVTLVESEERLTIESSKADGVYKMGTAESGTYAVTIDHPDYDSDTVLVDIIQGQVTLQDFRLWRKGSIIEVGGFVMDADGNPIADARLIIENDIRKEESTTELDGFYKSLLVEGVYNVKVAAWGYKGRELELEITADQIDTIVLQEGYEDDFFVDLGWEVSGDAQTGIWIRDIPNGTQLDGNLSNPDQDVPNDIGDHGYVTGNLTGSVGTDDVDNGATILTSPAMDISDMTNPIIEFVPWFYNGGGTGQPIDDMMTIAVLLDDQPAFIVDTISEVEVISGRWREPIMIHLDSIDRRAKTARLQISISDQRESGHLVEGGIDRFRLEEGPQPIFPVGAEEIEISLAPNPSDGLFYIDAFTNEAIEAVSVFNVNGRIVFSDPSGDDEVDLRGILGQGIYMVQVTFESGITSASLVQIL